MEERPKYGRKKLPEDEKRTIQIELRLNSHELKILQSKFPEENFRGHLRDFLLDSSPKYIQNDDVKFYQKDAVSMELRKIGINLNQLTYKVNLGEYPVPGEVEKLLIQLQEFLIEKLD